MAKKIFITGIPTAGKSYLANQIVEKIGAIHVEIDDIREELLKDERYKKWVSFYFDQDEKTYYTTNNYEDQWNNLVKQSEAIWPAILLKMREYENETKPVVFEGVNILPHLAHKDLDFPGIAIIGNSLEEVVKRNKESPRWGKTEELQKMEADAFFNGERPRYKEEAEKYGYKVFETAEDALQTCISILS